MTGDQQRPLARMTFELPPKREKGARHWKIKGKARKSTSGRRNSLWGYPEDREPGLQGEQKSSKYDCTLGARKSRNRSWQMLEPDQQGFLGRNWNRKGSKQVNHMT